MSWVHVHPPRMQSSPPGRKDNPYIFLGGETSYTFFFNVHPYLPGEDGSNLDVNSHMFQVLQ